MHAVFQAGAGVVAVSDVNELSVAVDALLRHIGDQQHGPILQALLDGVRAARLAQSLSPSVFDRLRSLAHAAALGRQPLPHDMESPYVCL